MGKWEGAMVGLKIGNQTSTIINRKSIFLHGAGFSRGINE
jgi:hypothetical protein